MAIRPILSLDKLEEVKKRLQFGEKNHVMASTLTYLTFHIAQDAAKNMTDSFKTVKKYTLNSLYVNYPSSKTPMNKQKSRFGTVSPYLHKLEDGFQPESYSFKSGDTVVKGRFIATKAVRNTAGGVKRGYGMSSLTDVFISKNSAGRQSIYKRKGKKLVRARAIYSTVKRVKPYRWLQKSLSKNYNSSIVQVKFWYFMRTGAGFKPASLRLKTK